MSARRPSTVSRATSVTTSPSAISDERLRPSGRVRVFAVRLGAGVASSTVADDMRCLRSGRIRMPRAFPRYETASWQRRGGLPNTTRNRVGRAVLLRGPAVTPRGPGRLADLSEAVRDDAFDEDRYEGP